MEPVKEITEQGVYVGLMTVPAFGSQPVSIIVTGKSPFLTARIIRLEDGFEFKPWELFKVVDIKKIKWQL